TASNFAIALAILAWPLIIYGLLSQLGDYHPSVSRDVIVDNRRISVAVLSVGFFCYLCALWLSGFSFTGAKIRSILAFACCLSLISFGVLSLWL
ncbi:MAG: hypothetical protein ABJA62_12320, partial [Luteimonas sp.]